MAQFRKMKPTESIGYYSNFSCKTNTSTIHFASKQKFIIRNHYVSFTLNETSLVLPISIFSVNITSLPTKSRMNELIATHRNSLKTHKEHEKCHENRRYKTLHIYLPISNPSRSKEESEFNKPKYHDPVRTKVPIDRSRTTPRPKHEVRFLYLLRGKLEKSRPKI